ncbi:hypothetical protein CDL15_Pgr009277 [Punica granatum]|uniref:Uncharacterized protein n=1 Tax=Punica granatum TaxID=22663 RepID=A0A218WQU3_PUNGR|nr:hypothetical protein CDL15_Pgr009277 [Punica granatum]
MHIYMYHTFLGRSKLGQSKTLPGQTEKVLGWRIRAKSPIDEEEMGDWSLEKGEMLEKKKGRRGKKKGVGLKTNGLGFGPTLTWPSPRGLDSKLNPESRIDPIPRFRDSWPDSPAILRSRLNPLNRSRIPPPNRRIVRFYDSNHDSDNHGHDDYPPNQDPTVHLSSFIDNFDDSAKWTDDYYLQLINRVFPSERSEQPQFVESFDRWQGGVKLCTFSDREVQ